jgi:Raf kinase inhibitor-like YbhB/YbcL family protein
MKPQSSKIKFEERTGQIIAFAHSFLFPVVVFLILWQLRPVPAQGQTRSSLRVSSASFSNGGAIPRQFTCDGADASPSLQWSAAPHGTRSFALVMNDPDAPFDFTHWIAYNIPPAVRGVAEGASTRGAMPKGSAEGINDFRNTGYGGPCPPVGKPHHYVFRIYALDVRLDLPPGATRRQLDSVIERHIVAEGQIVGVYRRAIPVAR